MNQTGYAFHTSIYHTIFESQDYIFDAHSKNLQSITTYHLKLLKLKIDTSYMKSQNQ